MNKLLNVDAAARHLVPIYQFPWLHHLRSSGSFSRMKLLVMK